MQPSQGSRSLPLPIVLGGLVLLTLPFHLRPDNFIVDDGYFYPQIARHIVAHQGSTFNTIMPTNGYHPLWMLVSVVAASITSASGALVQMLGAAQDALMLLSIALVLTIARAANKRGALVGCAPLIFFGMVLGIWRLLEAPLALALQLLVLIVAVPILPRPHDRLRSRGPLLLGFLLGLTLLARLDLIFFAITVLAYELVVHDPARTLGSRVRAVGIEGAVTAVLLAPYLAWNLRSFGHLEPISGAIKSSFPRVQHWHPASFVLPVIAGILLNAVLLLKRHRTAFDRLCLLTATAAALHLIYSLSFGSPAPWYLTTGYLSLSLALIGIVDRALALVPSLLWIEPVSCILLLFAFFTLGALRLFSNFSYTRLIHGQVSFHGAYLEPKRALAGKLRATLPPGSRIYIFDAPGRVAFYSGMDLLPADGLVADFAYNTDVVRDGFAAYAARKHIDFFITPWLAPGQTYDRLDLSGEGTSAGQVMTVEAPLTHRSAGSVTLPNADLLFRFREINPDLEGTYPELGVWRIRHDDAHTP